MMIFFSFECFQEKNARCVSMQLYILDNLIDFNGLNKILNIIKCLIVLHLNRHKSSNNNFIAQV